MIGCDNFTTKQNMCGCDVSSEMTIKIGGPMSQYVLHAKEPSLLNITTCAEQRSRFAALHA